MATSSPLPVDILLGIFSTLSISDILNIRQTCRNFYEITKLRSLWHLLLRYHVLQKNLPIPGLGNRPIASLSASDLEYYTRRALKLRNIWCSRSPPAPIKLLISPIPDSRIRNIALQFLPGRDQRFLLSITAVAGERTNWFAIQCWNVDGRRSVCVARLRITELAGFAINTDPNGQSVLALLVPQSVSSNDYGENHKLMGFCSIETFTLNFTATNPESTFVRMATYSRRRFKKLHLFSGSNLLSQSLDGRLVYLNMNTPDVEAELRDTSPQLEGCQTAVIYNDFAMVIRPSHFQLYPLSPYRVAANSQTRTCIIQPIAQYRWQWPICSVVMSLSAPPYTTTTATSTTRTPVFPAIRVLIRFTSMGGWPDNVLHHYILRPNPTFSRANIANTFNVPYLPLWPVQSIVSPVNMNTTTHAALSPYGRAAWIDSYIEGWLNGQRLAGEILRDDDDDDDNRETATRGNTQRRSATISSHMMARTTFEEQEPLNWLHVALDETGSQIAIGNTDGRISVLKYV